MTIIDILFLFSTEIWQEIKKPKERHLTEDHKHTENHITFILQSSAFYFHQNYVTISKLSAIKTQKKIAFEETIEDKPSPSCDFKSAGEEYILREALSHLIVPLCFHQQVQFCSISCRIANHVWITIISVLRYSITGELKFTSLHLLHLIEPLRYIVCSFDLLRCMQVYKNIFIFFTAIFTKCLPIFSWLQAG